MNCEEARAAMLVAEPGDLQSLELGTDMLSLHVNHCSECAIVAHRIVTGEAQLRAALAFAVSARSPRGVARAAIARRKRWQKLRKRTLWASVPLLAAAAAIMLVVRMQIRDVSPVVHIRQTSPPARLPTARPGVVAPQGHSVAVFRSTDSKATLYWIF